MDFKLSIYINHPPVDVFTFLRDKDLYPQKEGSPILVLEKTTPGPCREGTRYREVVQMMPFVTAEILSEITCCEPEERLEEDFSGGGMEGHLAYSFEPEGDGTRLVQIERLQLRGALKLFDPLIRATLSRRLMWRLEEIKSILESGWQV